MIFQIADVGFDCDQSNRIPQPVDNFADNSKGITGALQIACVRLSAKEQRLAAGIPRLLAPELVALLQIQPDTAVLGRIISVAVPVENIHGIRSPLNIVNKRNIALNTPLNGQQQIEVAGSHLSAASLAVHHLLLFIIAVRADQVLLDIVNICRHGRNPFHILNVVINGIHHLINQLFRIGYGVRLYRFGVAFEADHTDD
ncbi:hypothetical protein D3C73_904860 [compost metagenome]